MTSPTCSASPFAHGTNSTASCQVRSPCTSCRGKVCTVPVAPGPAPLFWRCSREGQQDNRTSQRWHCPKAAHSHARVLSLAVLQFPNLKRQITKLPRRNELSERGGSGARKGDRFTTNQMSSMDASFFFLQTWGMSSSSSTPFTRTCIQPEMLGELRGSSQMIRFYYSRQWLALFTPWVHKQSPQVNFFPF